MSKSPAAVIDREEVCSRLQVGFKALDHLIEEERIKADEDGKFSLDATNQLAQEINETFVSLGRVVSLKKEDKEAVIKKLRKSGIERFSRQGKTLPNHTWANTPEVAHFRELDVLRFVFNGVSDFQAYEPKDLITNEEAAAILLGDREKAEHVHALAENGALKLFSGGRYSRAEVEALRKRNDEELAEVRRREEEETARRSVSEEEVPPADSSLPPEATSEDNGNPEATALPEGQEDERSQTPDDLISWDEARKIIGCDDSGLEWYTDWTKNNRLKLEVYKGLQLSKAAVLEVVRIRDEEYISLDEASDILGWGYVDEDVRERLFNAAADGVLNLQEFPGFQAHKCLKADAIKLRQEEGSKHKSASVHNNPGAPEPRETVTETITDEPSAHHSRNNPVQEPPMASNPNNRSGSLTLAFAIIIGCALIAAGIPLMDRALKSSFDNNDSFTHRPLLTPKRPPVPAQLAEESWFSESTTYTIMAVEHREIPGKPGKQVRLFCHEASENLWDCFEFIASPEDVEKFLTQEGKPFNFSDPWDADLKATKLKNGVRQFRHFILGSVTGAPPVWKFE